MICYNAIDMIKNQHYVPRWYLKQFASGRGQIYVYDKKEDSYFISSINNVCSESYFHATDKSDLGKQFSQHMESLLSRKESVHSNRVIDFLDLAQGSRKIDLEDKAFIANLFSHLYIRNKTFRETHNDTIRTIQNLFVSHNKMNNAWYRARHIKVLLISLLGFDFTSMIEDGFLLVDIVNMASNNKIPEKYCKNNVHVIWKCGLFAKPMGVINIKNNTDTFITTDNPAIEYHRSYKDGITDNAIFNRIHFLPLNHNTLIISHPDKSDNNGIKEKVRRKGLFDSEINQAEVLLYNIFIFDKSTRFVFGKTKKQLSLIKYAVDNFDKAHRPT